LRLLVLVKIGYEKLDFHCSENGFVCSQLRKVFAEAIISRTGSASRKQFNINLLESRGGPFFPGFGGYFNTIFHL
jgi:hypothetical protein